MEPHQQAHHGEPRPFVLTRKNFVLDRSAATVGARGPGWSQFFVFFTKGDLVSKRNTDVGFRNMPGGLKTLLKMLFYGAYACDGSVVRLVYLEPQLEGVPRESLSPHLRCSLTQEFCIVVGVPPQSHHSSRDPAGGFSFADDTSLGPDGDGLDGDVSEARRRTEALMVTASKRLICVDANLVPPVVAYIMRNDPDKTAELLSQFDFERWTYRPEALGKKSLKGGLRTCLDKPLPTGPAVLTSNSLFAAVANYFGGAEAQGELGALHPEDLLEFLYANLTVPDKSPVFVRYRRAHPGSPYVPFLRDLARGEGEGAGPPPGDLVEFAYSTEHLISKDDFLLFEHAPLLGYRHVEGRRDDTFQSYADQALTAGPSSGAASSSAGTGGGPLGGGPGESEPSDAGRDFRVNWPHLETFKSIAETVVAGGSGGRPMESLRLKCRLFGVSVLGNAEKIATEPSRTILSRLHRLLDKKGVYGLAARAGFRGSDPPRCRPGGCPTETVKAADHRFLETVMCRVFGVRRNTQAFLTLVHVLHTTAPKWKANRVMLVSHTRGGTGKTHTTGVIKRLFRRLPDLFGGFSSFTDTVFKYSEVTVGKVMVMDDVGLSQGQQKNSKREDTMMAAQFKSLLDTGFTNNAFTEKDPRTGAFRVSSKIMVANAAFVWNTNTLETFSDALMDRCVVVGPEPLYGDPGVRPGAEVEADAERLGLDERFETALLRQHLVQTLLFVACPGDGGPSDAAYRFAQRVLAAMGSRVPASKSASSHLRSEFKTMDLAMGEAVRLAVSALFDWWVPPWTVAPEPAPGETCREYARRLDRARVKAFKLLGLAEAVVEAAAQTRLFLPCALVQTLALHFGQSSGGVVDAVHRVLRRALEHNARDVFSRGPAGEVVIEHAHRVAPEFDSDRKSLMAGQDLWFRRAGGAVPVRLVEEVGPQSLSLNGFFALELLKAHSPDLLRAALDYSLDLFRDQVEGGSRVRPVLLPASCPHAVRNTIRFLAVAASPEEGAANGAVPEATLTDSGDVYLQPNFMGTASELLREDPTEARRALLRGYLNPEGETPLQPRMSWFSTDLVRELLAPGGGADGFSHSRCGMVPIGNRILYYHGDAAATGSSSGPTWEVGEALEVYAKYLLDTGSDPEEDLRGYLCYSSAPEAPAAADPLLTALRARLTASSPEEARTAVAGRYGTAGESGRRGHGGGRKRGRSRNNGDEEEGSPPSPRRRGSTASASLGPSLSAPLLSEPPTVSPPPASGFSFKRSLTPAGHDILERMRAKAAVAGAPGASPGPRLLCRK